MISQLPAQWLDQVVASCADAVFVVDRSHQCRFCRRRGEQGARSCADLDQELDLDGDTRLALKQAIERVLGCGQPEWLEIDRGPQGQRLEVQIGPLSEDDSVQAVLVLARTVSGGEPGRVSLQLERQAAELMAILDSIADGLAIFGPGGEITRMNAAAAELLPCTPEQSRLPPDERLRLAGFTWLDGSPIRAGQTPAWRALRGEVVKGEIMLLRARGRTTWLSTSAAPIRLPSGQVAGAVCTFVDVTALQELRQRQEDLVRMLSHDLRTPLNTVLIQAQILAAEPNAGEAVPRRAGAITTSARRMSAMIQDLVDIARLETGRLKLELRPLELGGFTADLKDRLAGTLDTRRIRIRVEEALPPVQADPDRLERILVNLLSNALKYSPADRPVELEALPDQGAVVLTVTDQGQGIPGEDLPHIFDRYYRARQTADQIEGLGLGLYITRLLVEAHGGRITAQSEASRGSTFRVWLPAR